MIDYKINWTKQELEDLIVDVELLQKKEFAGKCQICMHKCPCVVRTDAGERIKMACPQCALNQILDFEEKLVFQRKKNYQHELVRREKLKGPQS